MTASDYPITTRYGQIAGYPLNGGFHRGEDRAMPIGTSVVVNGVAIAKSGTNAAAKTSGAGAHLHIGKFKGGVVQPPQGGGFSLNNPYVYGVDTVGADPTNGKFVQLMDKDGNLWVYLHLSEVNVTKGQVLKMDKITKEQENALSVMQTGSYPGKDYDYRFTGKDLVQVNLDALINFWSSQPRPTTSEYVKVSDLYVKKG